MDRVPMDGYRGYWSRHRWGPLAGLSEYERDRVLGLMQRAATAKPTDDERRLATAYVEWRRMRIWRTAVAALAAGGVVWLIAGTAGFYPWWLFLWAVAVGVVAELIRTARWRSLLSRQSVEHTS